MAPQHRGFKGAGQAARVGLQWRAMAGIARGTVVIERVESQALKGNPLGDPHVREVPVYLPPGYENGQEPAASIWIQKRPGATRPISSRSWSRSSTPDTERSRSPPFGP